MKRQGSWFVVASSVIGIVATISCGGKPAAEHEGEGEHGGADAHHEERLVRLSRGQAEAQGISLVKAGPAKLPTYVDLPGEIVFDPERVAHVVPRVAGIVREVHKALGDRVKEGEVLAVLESRELAEAKAAYLANLSRSRLAEGTYRREEALWKEKRISSEQEYLTARQAFEEAQIGLKAAEHQLHALGLSHEALRRLPEASDELLTRYELTAPLDGIVIEKHAARGEALGAENDAFTIADPTKVWAELKVFPKDLGLIRAGTRVTIVPTGGTEMTADGVIDHVAPGVSEETRTATARVALDNAGEAWRPGTFVTGKVLAEEVEAALVVPTGCLQAVGEETVVFVPVPEGFEPRAVRLGRRTETVAEVLAGLTTGDEVVKDGSFLLKSELEKAGFEEGHGH